MGLRDLPALVRVPGNDPVYIKRVLDMGATGIIAPHIHNAEEARQAVAACKYPPMGIRGHRAAAREPLRTRRRRVFRHCQRAYDGGHHDRDY